MNASDAAAAPDPTYFRVCSICRKPIEFGAAYYLCSVSTCNRSRMPLFFCSLPCWDAHLPEARHRDAWAEQTRAPTRDEHEAQELASAAKRPAPTPSPQAQQVTMENKNIREQHSASDAQHAGASDEVPHEILVVVSKLKAYIRARSGMNTSDAVSEVLSNHIRELCDRAIAHATSDGRKTVLDRDFKTHS